MGITPIEMQHLHAQIAEAETIRKCLPGLVVVLDRIANALEYQQGDMYLESLVHTKETK